MGGSVRIAWRGVLPLLLTALAWGCAEPRLQAGTPGGEHNGAAHADAEPGESGLLVATSPQEVAAVALSRCGQLSHSQKQGCYDPILMEALRTMGVRGAMLTLDRVTAADPDAKRDAHVYAHGIGIAAYTGPKEVSTTFASCTPAHQSGCYHGVVQAYFMDSRQGPDAVTPEKVNALCNEYRWEREGNYLQFQCAHGIGHGLVMFRGHNLFDALKDCDLLRSDFERETCYQGAFMESVVNAIMPHHPSATLAKGDGHGGDHGGAHGHHGAAPASTFKALDPNDLLYPCSAVAERYWSSCYSFQTSAMLHLTGYDLGKVAAACERVPAKYRTTCFTSLGRDISGMTVQDRAEARKRCGVVSNVEDRAWCHVGAASNMLNVTARAEDGVAYCRELPGTENKARCYELIGGQILVLEETDAGREAACRTAEPEFLADCRRGARLSA